MFASRVRRHSFLARMFSCIYSQPNLRIYLYLFRISFTVIFSICFIRLFHSHLLPHLFHSYLFASVSFVLVNANTHSCHFSHIYLTVLELNSCFISVFVSLFFGGYIRICFVSVAYTYIYINSHIWFRYIYVYMRMSFSTVLLRVEELADGNETNV